MLCHLFDLIKLNKVEPSWYFYQKRFTWFFCQELFCIYTYKITSACDNSIIILEMFQLQTYINLQYNDNWKDFCCSKTLFTLIFSKLLVIIWFLVLLTFAFNQIKSNHVGSIFIFVNIRESVHDCISTSWLKTIEKIISLFCFNFKRLCLR